MYFKAFVEAGSSICYAAAALAQSYSAGNMKSSRSLGDEHTHQSIPGQQLAQENSTLQPVHTHVLHQLHMPHHRPQTGAAEGRLYDCRSATLWLNGQYLPELPPPPLWPQTPCPCSQRAGPCCACQPPLRCLSGPVHTLTIGLVHHGCFMPDDQLCLLPSQQFWLWLRPWASCMQARDLTISTLSWDALYCITLYSYYIVSLYWALQTAFYCVSVFESHQNLLISHLNCITLLTHHQQVKCLTRKAISIMDELSALP